MITRRKFIAATALIGPLALVAKNTQNVETTENAQTSKDQEKPIIADWLFVQNARSITYSDGKLTLKGVNPITVLFTDRPERAAEHMSTEKFVPFWSEGKESFLKDPPNASLSILDDKEMVDTIVTLHDPILQGEDLSYRVEIIDGEIPARGGPASLFIDIIGMPLTPVSFAGVHRRRRRRFMYRR